MSTLVDQLEEMRARINASPLLPNNRSPVVLGGQVKQMRSRVAELAKLEVYPLDQRRRRGTVEPFKLTNQGPMVVTLASSVINVSIAHLAGPSTDVTVGGTVLLKPRTTLDLRVNGDVNLAVARNFEPDIETTGRMTINASMRWF